MKEKLMQLLEQLILEFQIHPQVIADASLSSMLVRLNFHREAMNKVELQKILANLAHDINHLDIMNGDRSLADAAYQVLLAVISENPMGDSRYISGNVAKQVMLSTGHQVDIDKYFAWHKARSLNMRIELGNKWLLNPYTEEVLPLRDAYQLLMRAGGSRPSELATLYQYRIERLPSLLRLENLLNQQVLTLKHNRQAMSTFMRRVLQLNGDDITLLCSPHVQQLLRNGKISFELLFSPVGGFFSDNKLKAHHRAILKDESYFQFLAEQGVTVESIINNFSSTAHVNLQHPEIRQLIINQILRYEDACRLNLAQCDKLRDPFFSNQFSLAKTLNPQASFESLYSEAERLVSHGPAISA